MIIRRAIVFSVLSGCAAGAPAPVDQAKLATYTALLQGCIAEAKATDGGLTRYEACAKAVDESLHDGGVK